MRIGCRLLFHHRTRLGPVFESEMAGLGHLRVMEVLGCGSWDVGDHQEEQGIAEPFCQNFALDCQWCHLAIGVPV